MSKEFIKKRVGAENLEEAKRQQRQLLYFTKSSIQYDVSSTWFNDWTKYGYETTDDFLSWVCLVFKEDNYKTFFKYLRFPIASAKIVRNKIQPELSRVFFSEDSHFDYAINGEETTEPDNLKADKFRRKVFEKLLYNHNDILIHDLKDVNDPKRYFVSINDVVAIESHESIISRIAFTASIQFEEKEIDGYIYIDDQNYIFYDRQFKLEPIVHPHDLGKTPADYIASEPFNDKDVVRRSVFSDVRESMEEYVFLKTLQRMTEPNGSIPIVTKLKTKESNKNDKPGDEIIDPSSAAMAATRIYQGNFQDKSKQLLETGTQIEVPAVRTDSGAVDMNMVSDFLNFFYLPVEAMTYVNDRLKEIEKDIVLTVTGDFFEPNESAQNELQVSRGYMSKEDKLRVISFELSRICTISDNKFLGLQHGADNVVAHSFFGSDFFLESQEDIYNLLEKSPNPIESKANLIRLANNRGRTDRNRAERDLILYKLMPYATTSDFSMSVDNKSVDEVTFEYQTRFNYWINTFESQYGDIVLFWNVSLEGMETSEKFLIVNNLITDLINKFISEHKTEDNEEANSTPEDIQEQERT